MVFVEGNHDTEYVPAIDTLLTLQCTKWPAIQDIDDTHPPPDLPYVRYFTFQGSETPVGFRLFSTMYSLKHIELYEAIRDGRVGIGMELEVIQGHSNPRLKSKCSSNLNMAPKTATGGVATGKPVFAYNTTDSGLNHQIGEQTATACPP